MELSELMQLAVGQKTSLVMGDLPRPVAAIMNCHPAIVYLGHNEFRHIASSHLEMQREEFQMIPWLIKGGAYYFHEGYPKSLTIFGELAHDNKLYTLGLKSANGGCEVWIQTMFRTGLKKALRRVSTMSLVHGRSPFPK
ncbi:MAG: hypothetical protein RIB57_13575 [Pelagibacterium sp.]|uniref:hypothetical protein n=1 Tax=Pelagibacterium sp. TaxID=1967288 RepID=UPI0032EDA4C6